MLQRKAGLLLGIGFICGILVGSISALLLAHRATRSLAPPRHTGQQMADELARMIQDDDFVYCNPVGADSAMRLLGEVGGENAIPALLKRLTYYPAKFRKFGEGANAIYLPPTTVGPPDVGYSSSRPAVAALIRIGPAAIAPSVDLLRTPQLARQDEDERTLLVTYILKALEGDLGIRRLESALETEANAGVKLRLRKAIDAYRAVSVPGDLARVAQRTARAE